MGTIVVGVDGSEESKQALRWAAEEARLRGADLKAVHVYAFNPEWRQYAYAGEGLTREQMQRMRESFEQGAEQARQAAEALVETAVNELGDIGVRVETVALQDRHPAQALVEQSRDADLLVVGSRGRGGFAGLVLGSVSQQSAQHASCPVVIVRPREEG